MGCWIECNRCGKKIENLEYASLVTRRKVNNLCIAGEAYLCQKCMEGMLDYLYFKDEYKKVVKCKDCCYYKKDPEIAIAAGFEPEMYCSIHRAEFGPDAYCSYGRTAPFIEGG